MTKKSYGIDEELNQKYILKYVSQEEIFEHFLNIEVQLNEYFCSPLRNDNHPTCNFNWYAGKLWYKDWAENKPKDCFQVVKELYHCDFFEAMQIIKRELILKKEGRKPRVKTAKEREVKKKSKATIQVQFANQWPPKVLKYIRQYGIEPEICRRFNVFPIKKVWLNKNLFWSYSNNDPALGYYFGNAENEAQRWKIYFFERENYRFLCNTNRINGWIQLPDVGKNLIITKSLKDVMSLYRLGYHSIAMQNETTEPYGYIIEELNHRFDQLWSFYDFDEPGIRLANTLNNKYQIPYIFLTNGNYSTKDYGSKDISDYIRDNDLESAKKFLQPCIKPTF